MYEKNMMILTVVMMKTAIPGNRNKYNSFPKKIKDSECLSLFKMSYIERY